MVSQLQETLELIKKLNQTHFAQKKISKDVFGEQQKNLDDLKELLDRYSGTIRKLKEKEFIERFDLTIFYAEVHATLCDLVWHIDQVDGLLTTFLKSLPEVKSQD